MTPEGKILEAVRRFCAKQGVHIIRMAFRQGMETGWPDLCVLIPGGRPYFIELKSPVGKPTARQLLKISQLREAGYDVDIYNQPDAAIAGIQKRLGS